MRTSRIISIGLAIFTMLFGAGNVVFPLVLGCETGGSIAFAILGIFLTGVLVPIIGLVSASLFDGDYKQFLNMMGKIPGSIIALICMLLVGPFGAIPRCVTLAYAAVNWHFPQLSLFVFSIIVAIVIFFSTVQQRYIVDVMGKVLGPIKLVLLFSVIIIGLFFAPAFPPAIIPNAAAFWKGFNEGYLTLDLIATIFFSGLIIKALKTSFADAGEKVTPKKIAAICLKSGLIGGMLLGLVYAGFALLTALNVTHLSATSPDLLLSAIVSLVLGARASILANVTMSLACLSTAMALSAVFAEYLAREFFNNRVSYAFSLLCTVLLVFAMTNLGFSGISTLIEPVAMLCYPTLIVLAISNIVHVLFGFRYVRVVVIATFLITTIAHFWR